MSNKSKTEHRKYEIEIKAVTRNGFITKLFEKILFSNLAIFTQQFSSTKITLRVKDLRTGESEIYDDTEVSFLT